MPDRLDNDLNQRTLRNPNSTTGWIIGAIVAIAAIGLIWYFAAGSSTRDATVTGSTEPPAATVPAPEAPANAPAKTAAPPATTPPATGSGGTTAPANP